MAFDFLSSVPLFPRMAAELLSVRGIIHWGLSILEFPRQ